MTLTAPRRNSRETLPALQLASANDDTRREIEPEHPLYALAAWAYHHAHEIQALYSFAALAGAEHPEMLPKELQATLSASRGLDVWHGLFEALSAAWPYSRQRAQKGGKAERVRMAYLLAKAGASNDDIASALDVDKSTVEKYKREARRVFNSESTLYEIRVLPKATGLRVPPDPGDALDLIARWLPIETNVDVRARAAAEAKAEELGLELFSAGPPSPTE